MNDSNVVVRFVKKLLSRWIIQPPSSETVEREKRRLELLTARVNAIIREADRGDEHNHNPKPG